MKVHVCPLMEKSLLVCPKAVSTDEGLSRVVLQGLPDHTAKRKLSGKDEAWYLGWKGNATLRNVGS